MVITPDRFVSAVAMPEVNMLSDSQCRWFIFQGNSLLTHTSPHSHTVICGKSPLDAGIAVHRTHYLGHLDNTHCFVAESTSEAEPPEGMVWQGLRGVFGQMDEEMLGIAGRALQILDWDRCHQFCSRCATPTELGATERARVCPSCSYTSYPRIAPAMMVLIRKGQKLLLARPPQFTAGMYSALAGFVEPGETLEQTVHREVMEEVGLKVDNLRYFASQSWPFPHSLMVAFTCDWVDGDIVPQPDEIEAAEWFDINALPLLPPIQSISRHLIESVVAAIRSGQ